jgi:diguanylate cyclase (GGDEF)-like protein
MSATPDDPSLRAEGLAPAEPAAPARARRSLPLGLRLTAIGLVGLLVNAAVVQSALAGFGQVERSRAHVEQVGRVQRFYQDAAAMHAAIHTVVLEAQLSAAGLSHEAEDEIEGNLVAHGSRLRADLAQIRLLLGVDPTIAALFRRILPAEDAFVADAERLARLAFTDLRAARADHAEFDQSLEQLQRTEAAVTAQLERTADQATRRAAEERAAAERRIVIASAAGLLVLLGLAVMLGRVGGRLAVVVDELRAGAARQRFAGQLARALEMADGEADAHQTLQRAMTHVAPATPMELLLADSSEAQLERVAASPTAGAPGCPVQSPWGCMAVRRAAAITFESSEALDACPKLRDRPSAPRSAACIPITFMGRALGVLHATGQDGDPPGPVEVEQLRAMASQAGTRLGTLRTFERTELQAATDALTGLMNRRTLENRLQALLATRQPFALALADLDHFKRLNDTHGHAAGDRALRLFARTIAAGIREGDLFARYGGEEFVLVFPGRSVREAVEAIERQRTVLAGAVAAAGGPVFTVSFGVTDSTAGATVDEVLRVADGGLLQAKALGRDRVVVAGGAGPALEAGAYGRSSGSTQPSTTETT